MRRRLFLHLVVSCVAFLPFGLPVAAAPGIHVSGPVVHDNLAVYFVHGSAAQNAVPMSLEEALARGRLQVNETGSVNELTVENVGDDEVFVQAGEIVKGGRQDRVLSMDLLLPPSSGRVSIAAFCVESGRWSARGQEDPRQFSTAAAAKPSHEAKLAMRNYIAAAPVTVTSPILGGPNFDARAAGARHQADAAARQAEIWANVRETQEQLSRSVGAPVAAPASPSSLQLSLESAKLKEAQAAYIDALQGAGESSDNIVGYVFAINGKISGGDVYASSTLFRKMWRKLLTANVTEAIGEKKEAGAAPPSLDDVQAFLTAAESAPKSERALNASVRLVTRDGDSSLYAETQRADGGWVHRNYLTS
jgi:hypothetical protein